MHGITTLIVALSAIVAPITAAPSHREISIVISNDNGHVADPPTTQTEICWMACFADDSINCPDPMYVKKFGVSSFFRATLHVQKHMWVLMKRMTLTRFMLQDCYTCCTDPSKNNDVAEIAQPKKYHKQEPQSLINAMDDVCWRACFPAGVSCPSGMYEKQFGDCWTCCMPPSSN
ncbi:hypothetical protein AOQ84DRAFT_109348 [Glonium stellatum]|uniref:Uncharacterized protein n=1 Tax=Glonium stellatum TaxID=574774 RepID=A0A8E2JPQ2_9PEZI|nr:hypothetical protein AOQ84DRAFT_109348 [Glonium stellatum]